MKEVRRKEHKKRVKSRITNQLIVRQKRRRLSIFIPILFRSNPIVCRLAESLFFQLFPCVSDGRAIKRGRSTIISVIIVNVIVAKRPPMLSAPFNLFTRVQSHERSSDFLFYFFSFPSLFIADQRVRYEVYFEWNAISIVCLNVDFDLIVIS